MEPKKTPLKVVKKLGNSVAKDDPEEITEVKLVPILISSSESDDTPKRIFVKTSTISDGKPERVFVQTSTISDDRPERVLIEYSTVEPQPPTFVILKKKDRL